jgi:hypothetical protein
VVVVKWIDSGFHYGEFKEYYGLATQETVGFFIDRTRERIRIAMSCASDDVFEDTLVIPITQLKGSVRVLRPKEDS